VYRQIAALLTSASHRPSRAARSSTAASSVTSMAHGLAPIGHVGHFGLVRVEGPHREAVRDQALGDRPAEPSGRARNDRRPHESSR